MVQNVQLCIPPLQWQCPGRGGTCCTGATGPWSTCSSLAPTPPGCSCATWTECPWSWGDGVMAVMAVLNSISLCRWAVWLLALLGITYQQLFHERYKALETLFYVIIATLPSLAVLEMVSFIKISYYFTIYILISRNKTCRYVCIWIYINIEHEACLKLNF